MGIRPKFDLYEWLGVSRLAPTNIVRLAYRRRARETHPDMPEGSREDFAMTQTALAVLTDPKRRQHYDATGEVEEKIVDNAVSNAVTQLVKIITVVIEEAAAGRGDLRRADIVARAKETLSGAVEMATNNLAGIDVRYGALKELEKRFFRKLDPKKPIDAMKFTFRGVKASLDKEKAALAERLESYKLALELIDDYRYEMDQVFRWNSYGS